MARMTKAEKEAERKVEDSFNRLGKGITFPIMTLGKLMQAGIDALKAGTDLDTAMKDAINKYRVN
jgi:hypothetical protein